MSNSTTPPGSGLKDRAPRILLVDDDVLILRTLVRLVRRSRPNWELVTATNAAEGLTVLKRERVDVLVTDIVMPGMSGSELIELVRSSYPDVACIVHSTRAHAVPSSVISETVAVLQKPVNMKIFVGAIDRALGRDEADHNGTE